MNYKVIEYTCNHKFIYITAPDKRILKDHGSCPTCGMVVKKHVTLFCQDCGIKIIEINNYSWQGKKRCFICGKIDQKAKTNLARQKKAQECNVKRRLPETHDIDFELGKKKALRKLYKSMDIILPRIETPILDRWMNESS